MKSSRKLNIRVFFLWLGACECTQNNSKLDLKPFYTHKKTMQTHFLNHHYHRQNYAHEISTQLNQQIKKQEKKKTFCNIKQLGERNHFPKVERLIHKFSIAWIYHIKHTTQKFKFYILALNYLYCWKNNSAQELTKSHNPCECSHRSFHIIFDLCFIFQVGRVQCRSRPYYSIEC